MMKMNSPFYRTHGGVGVPLHPRHNKPPSKVVSIPVHLVGSGSDRTRSESAIKIQKAARGFLVRRSMNRIAAILGEVEQIEGRVSAPETAELMRRDGKERARVSETLMNLLLRLDSVRALHAAVRDCRKSVINRAIALQEMLDRMAGPTPSDQPQSLLNQEEAPHCASDSDEDVVDSNSLPISRLEAIPVSVGASEVPVADSEGKKMEALDHAVDSPSLENGVKVEREARDDSDGEESVGTNLVEEKDANAGCEEEERGSGEDYNGGGREVRNGNRELLERMVEDNERMMGLMAQLFERNEMQTRLLSSLSHRVGQLERAFACEMLRKMKKRRNSDAGQKES